MANPQPTPFVRFSKELFEAFYQDPPETLAGTRLWLWVFRWTWADFGKDETPQKTIGEIGEEVGMSRAQACKELQRLVRCRRLKIGKGGGYAIQKDYDLWRPDTRKRARHFGNTPRQPALFTPVDNPVDNLGITPKIVSNGETGAFHRGTQKRFTVAHSVVSPYETPIRSKNTVENGRRGAATPQPPPHPIPNGQKDSPRQRAQDGDPERPPEEHPDFGKLGFRRRDELTDQWKDNRAKRMCRKGCGRAKASEGWPFCKPCTWCDRCAAKADGKKVFSIQQKEIICNDCKEPTK